MSVTTSPAPQPAKPKRLRRAWFAFGWALILVGVGLLAYVAWQLFGTNVVAHQKQRQAVTQLQQSWASPEPQRAGNGSTPNGTSESLVRIPRFGKDYVMPVLQGIDDGVLARGFGHFPRSVAPGRVGNYALAAHRVTHGEPLRGMPELRPGDKVLIETRRAIYTYALDTNPNDLVVDFSQIWVVDPLPTNPQRGGVQPAQQKGQKLITLTTCSELFHTDNRMVAFGHLVRTQAVQR